MEEKAKFVTPERAFWAGVYYLCLTGLIANLVGGRLVYKEVWEGRKAFMIGEVEQYDSPEVEGATFTRKKGK